MSKFIMPFLAMVFVLVAGANYVDAGDRNRDLIGAAGEGRLEEVQRLINEGADVNAKLKDGYTALMGASWAGNLEVMKILIEKRVDVNAKNTNGLTALMFASATGNLEVVKLLLEKGADVNAKDLDGYCADSGCSLR